MSDRNIEGPERSLPPAAVPVRRTPTFTADTVPAALVKNHLTTAWARLEVEAGSVTFTEDDPPFERIVAAGSTLVIIPHRPHRVAPSPDAHFAVQFFELGDSTS